MTLAESLKDKILAAIDYREFWREEFDDWDRRDNSLVKCPLAATRHKGASDNRPSLSINGTTGEFNCHACGFHGTSVIGYYTDAHCDGRIKRALAILYKKYIGTVIPRAQVDA